MLNLECSRKLAIFTVLMMATFAVTLLITTVSNWANSDDDSSPTNSAEDKTNTSTYFSTDKFQNRSNVEMETDQKPTWRKSTTVNTMYSNSPPTKGEIMASKENGHTGYSKFQSPKSNFGNMPSTVSTLPAMYGKVTGATSIVPTSPLMQLFNRITQPSSTVTTPPISNIKKAAYISTLEMIQTTRESVTITSLMSASSTVKIPWPVSTEITNMGDISSTHFPNSQSIITISKAIEPTTLSPTVTIPTSGVKMSSGSPSSWKVSTEAFSSTEKSTNLINIFSTVLPTATSSTSGSHPTRQYTSQTFPSNPSTQSMTTPKSVIMSSSLPDLTKGSTLSSSTSNNLEYISPTVYSIKSLPPTKQLISTTETITTLTSAKLISSTPNHSSQSSTIPETGNLVFISPTITPGYSTTTTATSTITVQPSLPSSTIPETGNLVFISPTITPGYSTTTTATSTTTVQPSSPSSTIPATTNPEYIPTTVTVTPGSPTTPTITTSIGSQPLTNPTYPTKISKP